MCVSVYVCMYVCICVCVYICIHSSMDICVQGKDPAGTSSSVGIHGIQFVQYCVTICNVSFAVYNL